MHLLFLVLSRGHELVDRKPRLSVVAQIFAVHLELGKLKLRSVPNMGRRSGGHDISSSVLAGQICGGHILAQLVQGVGEFHRVSV